MANVKITDLTAYTNPASTDVLPIVDVGADVTKKVAIGDLLKNASSGTAAAPGIAFDGDSNTGIYSPGADQVAVATNGTGRLFVNAAGNVGLNEPNPGQRLVIGGDMRIGFTTPTDAGRSLVFDSNRSGSAQTLTNISFFWNSTGVAQIRAISGSDTINKDDGELAFFTTPNGSIQERMRITSTGLVGIGTTSPTEALTVAGNISLTASGSERFSIKRSTSPLIEYKVATGNYFLTLESVGTSQGAILFNTGTTAASERARIDSSGRLLVGTSSDSGGALLQVNGNRIRIATAKTPSSAADTGTAGEICWDADYIYVCTATNTWKRTAISTW